MTATTRQIALLRGINVGRNRRVGMAELRSVLGGLGYGDVGTHLQSGNVLLTSDVSGKALEQRLEQGLSARLGLELKVLVRSRAELAKVIARDPLGDVADNPSRYVVTFLARKLEPKAVRELAALAVPPEQFAAAGRELYTWHPDGIRNSELAGVLAGRRLGVTATARNWNTVKKLLELADA